MAGRTMGSIHFRNITRQPAKIMVTIILGKVRRARKSNVLNDGYFTSLTIITERNKSRPGSTYFQGPLERSRSVWSPHNRKNVSEATSPAAAGMGKPRNSLPPPPDMADRQLNRARRRAPQIR